MGKKIYRDSDSKQYVLEFFYFYICLKQVELIYITRNNYGIHVTRGL
ncbi:hypothetical protein HMPREF1860_00153 [Prevotella amnii]|uniref:Uncharacterized protein n=1 Tax=Prevotella amnii TaxID=419005 RepID=A0A134BN83_9BACT|nr:hypothetical protein HMPREF1860_00153 [Prevotella amnii]